MRGFLAALAMAVTLFGTAACSNGDERAGDQPVPDTDRFGPGLFDEIPRFPRSDPLGPRRTESDVVVQSFRVVDIPPREILDYYEKNLEDWNLVTVPQNPGETSDTWRGKWAREHWILTVSATPAPAVDNENQTDLPDVYSQYSLSLAPR